MQAIRTLGRMKDWSARTLREGIFTMFETWDNTERALRRRMRVYPTLATAAARFPNHPLLSRRLGEEDRSRYDADRRRREDARRTAIVSIHGKDLSSEDEIKNGRPERDDQERAA